MKDTKHTRQDFHSVAWVMPQGLNFWALGVPRGSKKYFFFQIWSCGISNRSGWRAEQNSSKILILWSNWWPLGVVKGQISLDSITMSISKIFYTKLCVGSHKWKIQNISDGIFSLSLGHGPGDFRALGVPRVKINSNMVMWLIKWMEMTSRTECK